MSNIKKEISSINQKEKSCVTGPFQCSKRPLGTRFYTIIWVFSISALPHRNFWWLILSFQFKTRVYMICLSSSLSLTGEFFIWCYVIMSSSRKLQAHSESRRKKSWVLRKSVYYQSFYSISLLLSNIKLVCDNFS